MESLGEILKKLRTERRLTLREVAEYLQVDIAILSKIERGQRNLNRLQIQHLASYYKVNENDLLVAFLSEKVLNEIGKGDLAIKALKRAEQTMLYFNNCPTVATQNILQQVILFFKNDRRVKEAFLYGPYACGDEQPNSKINFMLTFTAKKYGFYELLDISYFLKKKILIDVDIIQKKASANQLFKIDYPEIIKIY